jgi:DNA-binding transcriptional MerR regulator/methanogenic corrinoid protein MtbC1
VDISEDAPLLRIGALSRRLGVSDHVLRAWERRYGLLRPVRTPGGFRLYSEADARRIREMQNHLAQGLSAAEAARAVLAGEDGTGDSRARAGAVAELSAGQLDAGRLDAGRLDAGQLDAGRLDAGRLDAGGVGAGELGGVLREALDGFDEPDAQAALDRLFSDLSVTAVLRDVVLPYLGELGNRWERGEASIAQEHFASNLIRGRLAGLARGWGAGRGPRAMLACPPGERHDLALMMFGIALNRAGWRIDYLGADTPAEELSRTVQARRPDLLVLAATRPETLEPLRAALAALAREVPLILSGAGATPELAAAVGCRLLEGDPVSAAGLIGWPA